MYAIVGYMDEAAEKKIVTFWEELRDIAVTDYPFRRTGHRPHLTFSSFHEIDQCVLQETEQLTALYDPITLRFRLFGSFINSSAFLLLPDASSALTAFHQAIQNKFASAALYTPENWIPHVTLANHLDLTQQSAVQQLAQQRFKPFSGMISDIALIHITKDSVQEMQSYHL